ncbi:MAG: c-type cytochrome [Ferruginibacter sp.]
MKIRFRALQFLAIVILVGACKNGTKQAIISFENYKIADGFGIQLVAAEPLIEAPVAIDFDNEGRIWVVEMRGFMRDLSGTKDDAPTGRISILEDKDHDGLAESSKVFLDSLVLPRAIAHVYGGVLYTSPPFLWFVEIDNDKPGQKTLVDSAYAEGGSPEAQANGLMMNIDNWIYSANSQFRYQLKNGKWLKEPTSFRGQFGITKDDVGRLYYNYNTVQLAGDYVLPNTLIGNPWLKPSAGINKVLTNNQRVYPLHATTVNRGYVEGILDKDSMLLNVTAACGPLLYRGGQFPDEYNLNAFICEPQANLVKRNILDFKDDTTIAKQAWNDREFLASTDEGFRPVNLFNGPDGAMYVVDMHRGVMEYRAFSTPYYNEGIAGKKLDTLLGAGRILRVAVKNKKAAEIPNLMNRSAEDLVGLLKSNNGWIRDRAQQLLIFRQDKSVLLQLDKLIQDGKNPVTAIHALYVMDGLNTLSFETLKTAAAVGEPFLSAHALLLLQKFAASDKVQSMAELVSDLLRKNNPVINLYLATSLGPWNELSPTTFLPVLGKIAELYPGRTIYQEAIVSSLKGHEESFRETLGKSNIRPKLKVTDSLLALTIRNKKEGKMNSIYVQAKNPVDPRTNGLALFRNNCAACHGVDGDGIELVGPPLKGSEYVGGPAGRLAMILLNGLEGPIHINGQLYQFNNTMPGFGSKLNDKEIEDVIKYLHNAFVTKPVEPIAAEKIKELQNKKTGTLTEKQLIEMAKGK